MHNTEWGILKSLILFTIFFQKKKQQQIDQARNFNQIICEKVLSKNLLRRIVLRLCCCPFMSFLGGCPFIAASKFYRKNAHDFWENLCESMKILFVCFETLR